METGGFPNHRIQKNKFITSEHTMFSIEDHTSSSYTYTVTNSVEIQVSDKNIPTHMDHHGILKISILTFAQKKRKINKREQK